MRPLDPIFDKPILRGAQLGRNAPARRQGRLDSDTRSPLDPVYYRETRFGTVLWPEGLPEIIDVGPTTGTLRITYDGTNLWTSESGTIYKRNEATGAVIDSWNVSEAEAGMTNITWYSVRENQLWVMCHKGAALRYFAEVDIDTMTTISSTSSGVNNAIMFEIYGNHLYYIVAGSNLLRRFNTSTLTDGGTKSGVDGGVSLEHIAHHNDMIFVAEDSTGITNASIYAFDPASWSFLGKMTTTDWFDTANGELWASWDSSRILLNNDRASVDYVEARAYTAVTGSPPTQTLVGRRTPDARIGADVPSRSSVAGGEDYFIVSNYTMDRLFMSEYTPSTAKSIYVTEHHSTSADCQFVGISDSNFWWTGPGSSTLKRFPRSVFDLPLPALSAYSVAAGDTDPRTVIKVGNEAFYNCDGTPSLRKLDLTTRATSHVTNISTWWFDHMVYVGGYLWGLVWLSTSSARFDRIDPATGNKTETTAWTRSATNNLRGLTTDDTNLIVLTEDDALIFNPASPSTPTTTHSLTYEPATVPKIGCADGKVFYNGGPTTDVYSLDIATGSNVIVTSQSQAVTWFSRSNNYLYFSYLGASTFTIKYKISDGTTTTIDNFNVCNIFDDDGSGILTICFFNHIDLFDENTDTILTDYGVKAYQEASRLQYAQRNMFDPLVPTWGGTRWTINSDVSKDTLEGVIWDEVEAPSSPPPPPPGVPSSMLIGATVDTGPSVGGPSGETPAQATARFENDLFGTSSLPVTLQVGRRFDQNMPATFATGGNGNSYAQDEGVRSRIVSFKGAADSLPSVSQIEAFMNSCPSDGYITWCLLHHEPENDGGSHTTSWFHDKCDDLHTAWTNVGRSDVQIGVCYITWYERDGNPSTTTTDWFPTSNLSDFVMFMDPYTPSGTVSLQNLAGPTLALWRAAGGSRWGIAETGAKGTDANRAAWLQAAVAWADSEGAETFCWLNSAVGTEGDWQMNDQVHSLWFPQLMIAYATEIDARS